LTFFLSLADVRDIIVIAAGSLFILLLLAAFIFTVVLGLAIRALIGAVRGLISDEVTPLLQQSRSTVHKVQGTVTFVSENAVQPVVRVSAAVAGTRRMLGVLSGLSGRRNKQPLDSHAEE
jgi:hypothetical protein